MKKLIFFAALVCSMLAVQTAKAQQPVATLEHGETSKVFYGKSSFADAYNASVNGDQIYLSAGFFDSPASIAKGVKITGAGHFPIEGKQTLIIAGLNIDKGADSLRLEGLAINGDISYDANNSINYVKVIRCRLLSVKFQSISATASKNYCSFEECLIFGNIDFMYFGTNFLLRNSILVSQLSNIGGNALIDGNVFLFDNVYSTTFINISYSIIQNNIFLAKTKLFNYGYGVAGLNTNTINKNIFVSSDASAINGINKVTNYTGVAQTDIFINQTGNVYSYLHDYHLKKPATYLGTDGKQVGIYGGLGFKENGVPSNPVVVSKIVSQSTDTDGNLKINISVKAQDN
jgi:hypothetical protein